MSKRIHQTKESLQKEVEELSRMLRSHKENLRSLEDQLIRNQNRVLTLETLERRTTAYARLGKSTRDSLHRLESLGDKEFEFSLFNKDLLARIAEIADCVLSVCPSCAKIWKGDEKRLTGFALCATCYQGTEWRYPNEVKWRRNEAGKFVGEMQQHYTCKREEDSR